MRKMAVSAGVILLLVLAVVLAGQWLQRNLQAFGLEQLDWQQVRWADGALRAAEISGNYRLEQGRMSFRARQLIVRPVWRGGPRLHSVDVDGLQLTWQPSVTVAPTDPEAQLQLPRLSDFSGPLGWLPDRLEVRELQLQLPCSEEFCRLQGGLQVNAESQPVAVSARLGLISEGHVLSGWLKLQEQPDSYSLQAGAYIPEPLPLTGIGQLSGTLRLDLQNSGEQWLLREGQLQALLSEPQLAALASLPSSARPDRIQLHVTPQPGSLADWQQTIEFNTKVQFGGALQGDLTAVLALSSHPEWQVLITEGLAELQLEQWQDAGLRAADLTLQLPFSGQVNAQRLQLQLTAGADINVRSLSLPDPELRLTDIQAELASAQLELPLADDELLLLSAPVQLRVGRLQHPLLTPQSWKLQANVQQAASGFTLAGQLEAHSGLAAELAFNWPSAGAWQADLVLQEVFLRAANPLLATFSDWPTLLSFSSGRLTARMQAKGNAELEQLSGELGLTGADGIYDRSSFTGLNLPLRVAVHQDQLRLMTEALQLATLDPGLPLGPLRAAAEYRAALAAVDAGVLSIKSAQLGVLGGQVRLEPAALDMQQTRQTVTAVVEGVELTRLFEVYPAEGLSGQGTLDGRFPVSLVDGQLVIEGGQLQARQPGGTLRYQDDRLRELAANNPNMQQLASALEDFHYRVLASDVFYDQQGTLVLGLRLEGSNPNFQGGRLVNLNINLEEDIPALLTSLQLSGQVSDIIKERVQQYYLRQRKP